MSRRAEHNVRLKEPDFFGKPFPCPVCNTELRLKISRKNKPYCTCLDCGIQIFFRGQMGIGRLYEIVKSEAVVVLEFSGTPRALSLYKRLQHLKRQKRAFKKKQRLFDWDEDRDLVIATLDSEIKRIRAELKELKEGQDKAKDSAQD